MSMEIKEIGLQNLPDEGDPLIWLRKHREEIAKKYPTFEALCDYYSQFNSVEAALERVRAKIAEKKRKK